LNLQLKKHGIHQLVIGLIAHTCIEATVRYAAEFYHRATEELHCLAWTG
jgi:ureidoacrylate peracid hydrolase